MKKPKLFSILVNVFFILLLFAGILSRKFGSFDLFENAAYMSALHVIGLPAMLGIYAGLYGGFAGFPSVSLYIPFLLGIFINFVIFDFLARKFANKEKKLLVGMFLLFIITIIPFGIIFAGIERSQEKNREMTNQKRLEEEKLLSQNEIKLISPNGGEKLCSGQDYRIEWLNKGWENLTFQVLEYESENNSKPSKYYQITSKGNSYVNNVRENSFIWNTGTVDSKANGYGASHVEGELLKIKIYAYNESGSGFISEEDESDGFFSIVNCNQ